MPNTMLGAFTNSELVAQSCLTLRSDGLKLIRLLCPQDFPGKDTGLGSHFLLQGIFLAQRLNTGLLHCTDSLPPEPPRKPSHVGSH